MSDEALVALAKHAAGSLQSVDISMCRGITDDGVGQLADSCPRLTRLTVWGCTQLSGAFYLGHKRARMPSPYDVDAAKLSNALSTASFGPKRDDSVSASGLSSVDLEALSMRPLRIYGRPGDVVAAPDFD